jgi:hypothetical protein
VHREHVKAGEAYALREASETYARQFAGEIGPVRMENTIPWQENAESAETWRGPTRLCSLRHPSQPK